MGKSSSQTIGYHYRPAYHVVLTYSIDAFLEFRAAEKTAWNGGEQAWFRGGRAIRKRGSGIPINYEFEPGTGPLTSSGRFFIGAPNLFGGVKDQGGIVGPVDVMFGEAGQLPNPYLQSVFGNQVAAWRGFTTLAFCGGQFGAMNPMPQKPSYKVRKIFHGWGESGCWYPETAAVPFGSEGPAVPMVAYRGDFAEGLPQYEVLAGDADAFSIVSGPEGSVALHVENGSSSVNVLTRVFPEPFPCVGFDVDLCTFAHSTDDDGIMDFNGISSGLGAIPTRDAQFDVARRCNWGFMGHVGFFGSGPIEAGNWYRLKVRKDPFSDQVIAQLFDVQSGELVEAQSVVAGSPPIVESVTFRTESSAAGSTSWANLVLYRETSQRPFAMNPAHALYYVRTGLEKGREPVANINDESLRAAADKLYAEGFGVCWEYDPAKDTPDAFEERICRIIGGSFERSLTDGEWYLDLARDDYDIESLPIIGDDDILEFRELPTTLDRAVNSVAVRYFDVERKETVITPAVRALGLIRRFGEIHETLDFPEIPDGGLALRVADREGRSYVTPTRAFELVTTPRMKALRRNQYFRLQSPKRRIADMVCIIGSKEHGTLKSGAIRWKVSQDIYSLPETSYVEIEEGVDTTPPTTPVPIGAAKVFEAPYIDLVSTLPRGELDALPADAGYLISVAADPGVGLSYALCVQPSGADYLLVGSGEWCPTTTVVGAYPPEIGPSVVLLASVAGLDGIGVGTLVLWDDEWCRLDGLDLDTSQATLGRGCADTVPQDHPAGSRLWFYVEAAYDTTEYTDGESVAVKLLPETGSQQLPLYMALALPLEFAGRQARPYPPAALTVNGNSNPSYLTGALLLEWKHRDRVLQADQLIDQATESVGPEPGTTYTVRLFINSVLTATEPSISGSSIELTPEADGRVRIEVESARDGLTSWQMQVREFDYTATLAEPWELQGGGDLQDQAGNTIYFMG